MTRLGGGWRAWRSAAYVALDFEATGLDLAVDHIVSYGLVPIERGRVRLSGALYGLVRPPIPLPEESIRVHGIRPRDLRAAPSLDAVARGLVDALAGRRLVAHAAWVELGFLEEVYRRVGRRSPRSAIDVLELAAELERRRRGSQPVPISLARLAATYGVPAQRTHHALTDAFTTSQLFLVLATQLERLGVRSVRDLERAGRPQNARSFVGGPP